MKPFCIYLFRFVAVMAIPIMLMGCTHTLKSSEIPMLATGSPLKSIKPKTFAFKEFRDVRGTNVLLVAEGRGHQYILDQPAATVAATSIRKELERNGHRCMDYSPQAKADFIIEGSVYKYWLSSNTGGAFSSRAPITGNVAVKLTVTRVSADTESLSKRYEGEYYINNTGMSINAQMKILNQALLAMIKEISTDPELIAFIEK